ncbi:MAG: hypothetical protein ACYCYK_08350 [Candidatus Dormibacteria bacterium]
MRTLVGTRDAVGNTYRVDAVGAWDPPPRAGRARALLSAIDGCLNDLEERHLKGQCLGRQRVCHQLVESLSAGWGVTPPDAVWSARTSFALHAALLDWQSNILDEVVPGRRQRFPDLEVERDDWPIPRIRRTRRRAPGSLAGRSALVGAA